MRKLEAVRTVHAIALIFALLASEISLFPFIGKAYDSEEGSIRVAVSSHDLIQPIIRHPETMDKDFDGIQDSVENMISQMTADKSAVLPVVVTLYNPVSNEDLERFAMLGGRVTRVYRYVTYGFAGVIPAANISKFAALEKGRLSVIEYDAPLRYHLDVSVPLTQARPTVWETYGYRGSPSESIAIIDTGIDDSHPDVGPYGDLDFSKKIVGWYDATADEAWTPQDYGEHGTHVAGIAAGTGTANTLQGSGTVETTFTYILPAEKPGPFVAGYVDYMDVMSPGVIRLNCSWGGTNNVLLILSSPAGEVGRKSGTSKPLILTYNTAGTSHPTGRYEVFVGNIAGTSGVPFSCLETYPYQGLNDGYNLFTGVAPDSKLVGVKVFDNTGSGTTSTVMAGMEWVIENRMTYNITVASMSVGLENGATNTTLDQKADTMVMNGIVTVVSAGNDFPKYTIGSPGTAAYVITVAATNDQDGIASYSSNGDTAKNEYGLVKPDVAAPGGTFDPQFGNKIMSVDSNDVDAEYTGYADRNPDDYQQMAGTSMSTPHVSGLAALLIQAFGGWSWTVDEALKAKMLISMTSFEVQDGEGDNQPSLNRGEKDSVEGYGRVSADAAIEAATMMYNVAESVVSVLSSDPHGKKVWARQVSLSTESTYEFHLAVPTGADYDLYLYNGNPDSYGQPIILEKSVNASVGTDEAVWFSPAEAGTYFVVVKWVGGGGEFTLQSSSSLRRDVKLANILVPVTWTYAGRLLDIFAEARNEGGVTEDFEVTLYYSDVPIDSQLVSGLEPGGEKILTFSWNTTNVTPYVNHTISATASQVPGETDTTDNTHVNGDVVLRIPGDVNNDRTVNIEDLAFIARALRTDPSWPAGTGWNQWNPECDINGDNKVNVIDLSIAARNYGSQG